MLVDARAGNPAFSSVGPDQCTCEIKIEDPSLPTVVLSLKHGELEHKVTVHLGNSWIGAIALDDVQINALHSLAGLRPPKVIGINLLSSTQLPVEHFDKILLSDLYQQLVSTPGRGEMCGTVCLEEGGEPMYLHLYFASGATQVVTHAYGVITRAGTFFAPATEDPEIGGYKVIIGNNYACRHFAHVTAEQAKEIHDQIVEEFDESGPLAAAKLLRAIKLEDVLGGPASGESFSFEEVRALGFKPLEMTYQEIGRELEEEALVSDVRGFAVDEATGLYRYNDFVIWRPQAGNPFRVVTAQAVVFDGDYAEPAEGPAQTEGYAMRIGTFGDPVIFSDVGFARIREIHAAICQRMIETGSTQAALALACEFGGMHPNDPAFGE